MKHRSKLTVVSLALLFLCKPLLARQSASDLPLRTDLASMNLDDLMNGEAHGMEISGQWKVTDRWSLTTGYAFEHIHMRTDPSSADTQTVPFTKGAAPRHSAQLRSHFELPKSLALDAFAYEVGALVHQGPASNVTITAYVRLEAGPTWSPLENASFSLVGQNLLQARHLEFEDANGALQSSQTQRSVDANVTWRF